MLKDYYPYEANAGLTSFKFTSMVKGRKINKVVNFTKLVSIGEHIYNLAFGDYDENECKIEVFVVSNNGDRDKMLNTVALTVLDFFEAHPDSVFIARGSTPSRTRLYQMGINKNLDIITTRLDVFGFNQYKWEKFQSNINYESFYVTKRNSSFTL
ncbi:MAG TPA: hypothetical protein DHW64_11970 [Chitinophagaceae bacterium]|nr:hypothetical protein [Chitinophagaceae bacterium]